MDAEKFKIGREKLTRVFQYLQALNQHRNPATNQIRDQLWHLWLRDLPNHPSIRRGQPPPTSQGDPVSNLAGPATENRGSDNYVLKVGRPKLTKPPEPGPVLTMWLNNGWDDPFKEPTSIASRNERDKNHENSISRFEDDSDRVEAFRRWKKVREEWALNEQPVRVAMKIFETFYGLYGRVEREAEKVELVVGSGLLSWRRSEGGVFHPILLQRLQLTFDPSGPEFTVIETENPPELYTALFQSMSDVDGRAIARCKSELEQGGYSPLGESDTAGYLRRVVAQLSASAEFVEEGPIQGEKEYPRISHDQVLFLRARSLGFAAAIENVLQDLRVCEEIPWSLLNIVGIDNTVSDSSELQNSTSASWVEPEEVLLSKPANPEQIRIAQQIDSSGGVLVQGPPGTGKTHTVANLIGHLLAQGKSVLVTSHTTKALRMVRKHVVEQLQPLCVSVLENDLEGRKQLEGAVGSIAERLSRADAREIDSEASNLSGVRHRLSEKLSILGQRLIEARTDEYRDVVFGGRAWPPSEAARKVADDKDQSVWIPHPISLGASLPLSQSELIELYRTNSTLTSEDERELSGLLPSPSELLTPQLFRDLVREKTSISQKDVNIGTRLWAEGEPAGSPEQLENLNERMQEAVEPISGSEAWKVEVISAGQVGLPDQEPWDQFLGMMDRLHRMSGGYRATLLQYGPTLCNDIPLEEQYRLSEEIATHLIGGGNLGFFTSLRHRQWKKFISDSRVSGAPPRGVEHFRSLGKQARLKLSRTELAGRWDRQMAAFGAPPSTALGGEIERSLPQFADSIRKCLSWQAQVWSPLLQELKSMGFLWDKFLLDEPIALGTHGSLLRLHRAVTVSLPPVLASRANKLRLTQLAAHLLSLQIQLKIARKSSQNADVVEALMAAVDTLDEGAYVSAFGRLVELEHKKNELKAREDLLAKLEVDAPAWAAAIRDRLPPHDKRNLPGNAEDAWLVQQLRLELKRRASVSLEDLQIEIEEVKRRLRSVTVELIDRLSWGFQVKRTSLAQQQALIGWLDTWRAIGAGHGVRVPRLKAEAARKMTICRGAVPVWIMPLSRVVDNFDPTKTKFDVVIIDEASQSDIMALLACYMGRRVVVVGDHEQVSPSAVGQDLAVIQNLIDTHLQGIPNGQLYDGKRSIYDLARQSFGQTICLVEHFRCVPEIIQFSNDLCYQGRIKPLRDASKAKLQPFVYAHRVASFEREGKVNFEEASSVASFVVAAIEQPEYRENEFGAPTTFGIVSLMGEEQAIEIEQQLRARLSPAEYDRRRILCGTAAQFQGDERDVVFLSVVDVPGPGPLPLREQEMYKQRFNVGASRGRDQMWVVHSLNHQVDLKSGDLRKRLIEHALDPEMLMRAMNEGSKRVESEFERLVMRHLLNAGYRVTPQWKVGAYRIDLVVEGDNKRLAIECDGDRYHPVEKLADDMERQAILERLGWRFVRIRGSEFFLDPERAMKKVFARLETLEIPPEGLEVKPVSRSGADLVDRVKRRAEELTRSWQKEKLDAETNIAVEQT
ncbi:MAG TPA: AAA domain-containing protein [Candidatus Acidoferrales bacterium]